MNTTITRTAMLALAAGAAWSANAGAQPVIHNIRLSTPGNLPPVVQHIFAYRARARTGPNVDECFDRGVVQIAPPGQIKSCTAGGSGGVLSEATAISDALIQSLQPGLVEGSIRAETEAIARLGEFNSAHAAAYAYSNLRVRGQKADRSGQIQWSGSWRTTQPVTSKSRGRHRFTTDPLIGRLIDHTAGNVTESVMLKATSTVNRGGLEWENGLLSSTAEELSFEIEIPGLVTTQAGTLRVKVEAGQVTESVATGLFAGSAVPPVGAGPDFDFPLNNDLTLDYDLGGDPDHNLEVELDMDGGNDAEDFASKNDWVNGGLLNGLGMGSDNAATSTVFLPHATPGFSADIAARRLADDIIVEGAPLEPAALAWTFYQDGAPAGTPILEVFVRIWDGQPGAGGAVMAGDLFTNRLIDSTGLGMYRVLESEPPATNTRPLVEALIDMTWAPPLGPGHYWLEVAAFGDPIFGPPMAPTAVNRTGDENALRFDVATGQWDPVLDAASGVPMDFPFVLFVDDCYPDCNADGLLNLADFGCFQTKFVLGDPYADCNGDNLLNLADFGCFQTKFALDCP